VRRDSPVEGDGSSSCRLPIGAWRGYRSALAGCRGGDLAGLEVAADVTTGIMAAKAAAGKYLCICGHGSQVVGPATVCTRRLKSGAALTNDAQVTFIILELA
jgi:hypothetical protein